MPYILLHWLDQILLLSLPHTNTASLSMNDQLTVQRFRIFYMDFNVNWLHAHLNLLQSHFLSCPLTVLPPTPLFIHWLPVKHHFMLLLLSNNHMNLFALTLISTLTSMLYCTSSTSSSSSYSHLPQYKSAAVIETLRIVLSVSPFLPSSTFNFAVPPPRPPPPIEELSH